MMFISYLPVGKIAKKQTVYRIAFVNSAKNTVPCCQKKNTLLQTVFFGDLAHWARTVQEIRNAT